MNIVDKQPYNKLIQIISIAKIQKKTLTEGELIW